MNVRPDSRPLKSLGYTTDHMLLRHGGSRVMERDGYLVIETPGNPTFFWGNLLLFHAPPVAGDYERWTALFAREFAHEPTVKHMTLGWDVPDGSEGDSGAFVAAGFKVDHTVVLTATKVHPPTKRLENLTLRMVTSASEWDAVIDLQIESRNAAYERSAYAEFIQRRFATYRRMTEDDVGAWFGAFEGEQMVGNLGLFVDRGLGRFQMVAVHPAFRRRGVCGSMVYEVASMALTQIGAKRLVMLADETYHAARIYESVGFSVTERLAALIRAPAAMPSATKAE